MNESINLINADLECTPVWISLYHNPPHALEQSILYLPYNLNHKRGLLQVSAKHPRMAERIIITLNRPLWDAGRAIPLAGSLEEASWVPTFNILCFLAVDAVSPAASHPCHRNGGLCCAVKYKNIKIKPSFLKLFLPGIVSQQQDKGQIHQFTCFT